MSIIEEDLKEIQTNKTEHGETLETLTSDKDFVKKTIFSNFGQAYAFATLWSIAEENDITLLKRWLKHVSDSLISVNGQGRIDIVEVSKYKSGGSAGWTEKFIDRMQGR